MRVFVLAIFLFSQPLLSAQDVLTLKPAKSEVNFSVSHLAISDAEGSFEPYRGQLFLANDGQPDSVKLMIECKSVNTGLDMRDESIRESDWLNCQDYPYIKFHSTRVLKTPTGYDVQGVLTIKGVKHKVIIPTQVERTEATYVLKAFFEIDRYEYGVGGEGSFPAGREIKLDVSLTFSS